MFEYYLHPLRVDVSYSKIYAFTLTCNHRTILPIAVVIAITYNII